MSTTAEDLRRVTELEAFLADGTRWCRTAWSTPDGPCGLQMCLVGSWMHLHMGVADPGAEEYDWRRGPAMDEVSRLLQIPRPVAYNDMWGHAKVMDLIERARRRLLADVAREATRETAASR